MFDIITFGSATRDILVRPKNLTILKYGQSSGSGADVCLPLGSKIDVDSIEFHTGGGGTNTAATFALQGFKTAFCGMVDGDTSARELLNELKKLKVNTSLVQKTNKKPTNHSIIIFSENQDRTILAYRGASELLEKKDIPFEKLKTKWMYLAPLSGLLLSPAEALAKEGATLFEYIVDFAVKNNIKIALNPGIAQLSLVNFTEISKKIDVLILNQEEASFLTKTPFGDEKEIFKKISEICKSIIVMTRGGEGVMVSDGKNLYSAKPYIERKIVDTTGAGDAFGSGFVSEFIRSQDIEKAIQLGMANSAGALSEVGAKSGLLKKNQEFYKVEVERE
ncbi:MAG: hypothetical protein A3F47_01375 [Candidatus Staskawiczbacteria bacterium RIFCSPHIGHO2_12_FULL_38_11]|uniref:Carbohydrate kinase PfkB domain-containing protein n=1 Tax=Candidatus Staskawiczbacteria bacterium RIFCSPHIGHO2_12_FULL_38_11 TaxID=1802209 RepID=A0A1G2I7D4_9BACT|nr:MAG: hypothetical protein A3F47_01375 [Candidatus Staskawiczbacteria bacterium RIFCSPHIGHO2_12_FULL_38_11]